MALTTAPAAVPAAREVTALRRTFARRHAPRGNRAGTILFSLLSAYVVGGTCWWIATRPATVLTESALLDPAGAAWSATWAWVLVALAVAGGLATARAFGPITTTSAEASWLLSTPVDRAALLRPRLVAPFAAGFGTGLVVGRLAAFVASTTIWAPMTVLGAIVGCGVVAVAVLTQSGVLPVRTILVLQWGCGVVGIGLGVAAAAGTTLPAVTTWASVGITAAVTSAVVVGAVHRCGRLSRAEVDSGADLAVGTGTSLTALDASTLTGVLDARAWRRIGAIRSRHLPHGRIRAMIRTDVLRHRRRPSTVVIAAIATAAVWVVSVIGIPVLVALIQMGALFVVALIFSSGLRDLCADPALRVALGASDRALRIPLTVVPLAAITIVAALTAPTLDLPLPTLLISFFGASLAAYRMRTRPPRSYAGLILETGYGQVPVDLIRQLVRGPDVLLVAAVLLVLIL